MTNLRLSLAILFTGLALPASANAQRYAGWHSSLKAAAAESAKTGKPIFVVFRCER